MARREKKPKSKYERFAKFFCNYENGNYICKEVDEGLYVSKDNRVLFAKDKDHLRDFFHCNMDTEEHPIYACVWEHPNTERITKTIKNMDDTRVVETKRISVAGKRKGVPVVKEGCSYISKDHLEKALRTFKGDKVDIIFEKLKKNKKNDGCLAPVVVKDDDTGEMIMISPYFTSPLKP